MSESVIILCSHNLQTSFCVTCESALCSKCLIRQIQNSQGGALHEFVDLETIEIENQAFKSQISLEYSRVYNQH